MTGYVVVDKPDLRFREFDEYRAFYCGVCRSLKQRYGLKGQLTLNYDMTFLALLLTCLYDDNKQYSKHRCVAQPFSKHVFVSGEYIDYAADMNIILSYYKCLDDWEDEHRLSRRLFAAALARSVNKLSDKYRNKIDIIIKELDTLHTLEKENCSDIDKTAGCFGRILATVFAVREDEWSEHLKTLGFYLGKYVYILDAYVDHQSDIEHNRFNPLGDKANDKDYCRELLTMMMSSCAGAYEILPIVDDDEILKNIIYAGVWTGFYNKKPVATEGTEV